MMVLSVRAPLARSTLAWTLLGAWFAAFSIQDGGGLALTLIFGVSWLIALSAAHFTFTGAPHGLTGWCPVQKVLQGALTTALPALTAGALAWWVWPWGGCHGPDPALQLPAAHPFYPSNFPNGSTRLICSRCSGVAEWLCSSS
jgi:hypothetical protein